MLDKSFLLWYNKGTKEREVNKMIIVKVQPIATEQPFYKEFADKVSARAFAEYNARHFAVKWVKMYAEDSQGNFRLCGIIDNTATKE